MKKLLTAMALLAVSVAPVCAAETLGLIYQNATTPGGGYTATPDNKIGVSSCKSFFYIVGLGNCSVEAAMKNGKIKSLGGYDVYRMNILGYQQIKVRAWGN